MADSGQKFIRRNRAPRVHISYEDPYDAEKNVELPFVMGVLADLSGSDPGVDKDPIGQRKLLDIDMDNFDSRMEAIEPGVSFRVDNKLEDDSGDKLAVQLRFKKMADFSPAAIARQVEPMAKLLRTREQLANLLRYMDGKIAAEANLKKLLDDPTMLSALAERAKAERDEAEQANSANAQKE